MNIISEIVKSKYVANAEQIEELSRQFAIASKRREDTSGTYLNVLVAVTQVHLADADQLMALDDAHRLMYEAVIRGINATGVEGPAAQRRATFARTAKSTLAQWMKAGGNVQELEPGKVTKGGLREQFRTRRQPMSLQQVIQHNGELILEATKDLATRNPISARRELLKVIEALSHQLDDLTDFEPEYDREHRVTSHTLERTEHRTHG